RLLVLDAADALLDAAADGPAIVELEDLHWSDDLTLEILDAVARRVPGLPLLLVGTYRSDELIPRAPMRRWRSRLVSQRLAEEVRLQRLTPSDTATMLSVLLASDLPPRAPASMSCSLCGMSLPAPRDLVDTIHARTDGVPFHIEELLGLLVASGQWDPATGPAALADLVRAAAVPETVEEAIVARLAQRSPDAQAMAQAGAVVGRSFDLDLLAAVLDRPVDALGTPLTELAEHSLLLPSATP